MNVLTWLIAIFTGQHTLFYLEIGQLLSQEDNSRKLGVKNEHSQ